MDMGLRPLSRGLFFRQQFAEEDPGSVIAARAHIHMTTADAARLGVEDGQAVRVQVDTPRPPPW